MIQGKELMKLIIAGLFLIASLMPADTVLAYNIKQIESELNSKDWNVRYRAVEKLSGLNDKKSLELLIEVAGTRSEYWPVKIKAIQELGERADSQAIPVLLEVYNDIFSHSECPSIKSYVGIALGSFKNNEHVFMSLLTGIDDHELLTKEASIESLGRIGNPGAVKYLIPLLNDKSFSVRHSTIKALVMIGDKRAVPYLRDVAEKDKDPVIKELALSALKKLN